MKVLVITGDKKFGPGHERYELQKSAVEKLAVVYWGPGSLWPRLPREEFDVVTAQDPFWRGLFAWYVARKLGAKLNVQVHADLSGQSWAKRLVAGVVLRRANSVRVVSQKIKEQAERMGARGKITVLPVHVDVERFRHLLRVPHDGKVILWVGRFEQEKDPLYAIEVFRRIQAQLPDAALIMLGSGTLEEALKDKARGLSIEFPGWQDTTRYLPQVDAVLSTSRHESWGASMVEALAAGVPVIASDVGVAKEAGATVVPREEFAEAVIAVLNKNTLGTLNLKLPHNASWAAAWRTSLI